MVLYEKELTPVRYTDSGIKVLSSSKLEGQRCFRMHWHERMEIIRVTHGCVRVFFGTEEHLIHQGQMALFSPGIPHRGVAFGGPCQYLAVMFDVRSFFNETKLCRHFLSAIAEGRAKFNPVIADVEAVSLVDQIAASADSSDLECIASVYRFLDRILQHELIGLRDDLPISHELQKILSYIHENFAEDISTATLSQQFGYSSAHFCRKFKEATFLSPMKYLQIYRLEEALKLLREGDRSISDVAVCCGFSDQNYFSRCFKAHFGVPPREYRSL